ncbi:MAG: hypothetical protein ABSE82_02765 [Nitrososphaerales archaeon]|jgi:hypothetical protein
MTTVGEYIAGIKDPKLKSNVEKLRLMDVRSLAGANESVKPGMPSYSIAGEKNVAIAEYKAGFLPRF